MHQFRKAHLKQIQKNVIVWVRCCEVEGNLKIPTGNYKELHESIVEGQGSRIERQGSLFEEEGRWFEASGSKREVSGRHCEASGSNGEVLQILFFMLLCHFSEKLAG